MSKIVVPYEHRHDDTDHVYLAVAVHRRPPGEFVPALRDIIDGKRVVRIDNPGIFGPVDVWIRDRQGQRIAKTMVIGMGN